MVMPVATPMAKLMPNSMPQNLTMSRQIGRPVMTHTLSMMASRTDRPSVRGTNRKWYMAVRPNCRRESSTRSIGSPGAVGECRRAHDQRDRVDRRAVGRREEQDVDQREDRQLGDAEADEIAREGVTEHGRKDGRARTCRALV